MVRLRWISAVLVLGVMACEVTGSVGSATQAASSTSGEDVDVDASSSSESSAAPEVPGSSESSPGRDEDVTSSSSGSDESSSETIESNEADATTSGETEDVTAGSLGTECCAPGELPGCSDVEVTACVCAIDPYCCDTAWDEACVAHATSGECGQPCEDALPAQPGSCCDANVEGGNGCIDEDVQECVCAMDPYCCLQNWDDVCVGLVDDYGCGSCI